MSLGPADREAIEAALAALHAGAEPPPDDVRRAAVAILLRGSSLDEADVLLMQRAERKGDRWSGQISLPGGHEEEGDDDLAGTARRESREEVGIDPGGAEATLLGEMPAVQARARGERIQLYITPVVFHRRSVEPPTLGPEAADAFWLPLSRLVTGELDETIRYPHGGLVHQLPSWSFEGRTIWGMTHGILSRFVRALADAVGSP